MTSNLKIVPVNYRCQVLQGNASKDSIDINLIIHADSRIYDFGSNASHFCILSEDLSQLKLLSNYILNYIHGSYLFVELYTNNSICICVVISISYLKSCIPLLQEFDDKNIEELLKKMRNEFSADFGTFSSKFLSFEREYSNSTFKQQFLQSYYTLFIYDLLKYFGVILGENDTFKSQSLEIRKIKNVMRKVEAELYKTCPTVQSMAIMTGMSVSKFKLLFQKEFNESPHQYILGRKLILARELLQAGELSISQVSYKIGFNHPSGFTRLFKHKFQYPPSEFFSKN
ncbi:helix-turn-helix protein [Arcicella aurantiaca]|uniref:Helix-turn-helix protein n=1 Tax=Arcicella aurantiaca TaxID=591202 RepID=A0A316E3W9_9BACT|nr:response regulator transcription factor [Arcicella aurantiaca]PWK17590.1 helix-turn-helix protein [Arcicella aurantiaca]